MCCVYLKEPYLRDGSFEHTTHMFKLMGNKIIKRACAKTISLSGLMKASMQLLTTKLIVLVGDFGKTRWKIYGMHVKIYFPD